MGTAGTNEEEEAVPILVMLQTPGGLRESGAVPSNLSRDGTSEQEPNGGVKCKYSPWEGAKGLLRWFMVMREAFGAPFLGVVMIVYGVSQGYAETIKRLATNYYWKDVQKMQPVAAQAFTALPSIPWDIKPIYGIITDTFPIAGYQRWPYLAICGVAGCLCLWALAILKLTPWLAALLMAGVALCTAFPDVVADAAVAQRSKISPELASDLQGSLCPDISEAMFFWLTDPVAGPGFGEEFMGFINAVGYMAMLVGVAGYNCWFRHFTFRKMFLWPQVMSAFIGLVDIILVTKINRQMRIPDHVFILGDKALTGAISRLQLMPMLILSAQLCPSGIEGTVFAFLMSVSNFGNTSGSWAGAALLKWLHIQRNDYSRLWLAVLIRSLMRLSPLLFLFLVPDCTVESIRSLNIAISYDSGMEQTAKDMELCDKISVHEAER